MTHNAAAMVSVGVKSNEFPTKHLAKTFNFVLSFSSKAKSKDLAVLAYMRVLYHRSAFYVKNQVKYKAILGSKLIDIYIRLLSFYYCKDSS